MCRRPAPALLAAGRNLVRACSIVARTRRPYASIDSASGLPCSYAAAGYSTRTIARANPAPVDGKTAAFPGTSWSGLGFWQPVDDGLAKPIFSDEMAIPTETLGAKNAMENQLRLWYDRPAGPHWHRALPIGNGRLGAMVFGNLVADRVQLNEDSLWNGGPRDRTNPSARQKLPEIRQLLRDGKLAQANALVLDALSGIPDSMRCYEPLGDLLFTFEHPGTRDRQAAASLASAAGTIAEGRELGTASEYQRELDLERAVAQVTYAIEGVRYRRQYLASAPANVIAIRLTADRPGAIHFRLRIERGPRESYSSRYADTTRPCGRDGVLMTGRAGGEDGVRFAACLRVATEGGRQETVGETICVTGANSATIVLAAATSFRHKQPARQATAVAQAAQRCGWDKLQADHNKEYSAYFGRADLTLGNPTDNAAMAELPTDQRLARLRESKADSGVSHFTPPDGGTTNGCAGRERDSVCCPAFTRSSSIPALELGGIQADPGLDALYFHFARYLLISASRPGSLPANLQGIWNEDFWPAWGAKYTININTEMNYWPAEAANLGDCHTPLFDHVERMLPDGRRTARVMYGCRGFMAHHNTDLWGDTTPTDRNLGASYWLMGGAWLSLHFWEHYAYHRNPAFLRRAYPVLKDASRFFLDFLVENRQGRLVVSPSSSPENVYRLPTGEAGTLCEGTTMDSSILEILFRRTRDMAEILGVDAPFRRKLEQARQRLPAPAVGSLGQLLEWPEEFAELDPRHRHCSHLFLLHPGDRLVSARHPELAAAARVTLNRRGDEGTGWCMAWKACFWARLGDGPRAYKLLRNLIHPVAEAMVGEKQPAGEGGGAYPNLFCAHPPFQIDGNFGGATAILEMLLQSHDEETDSATGKLIPVIHLLPALPPAWADGAARGLRARGGFELDFAWRDGALTHLTLTATVGGAVFLRHGPHLTRLETRPGEVRQVPTLTCQQ